MPTVEELARIFGGVIRTTGDVRWIETEIGGLRAGVIRRARAGCVIYDLAVITPWTREQDPLHHLDQQHYSDPDWRLDGEHGFPTLGGGYVFAGCRGGVLFASALSEPALENIVTGLWELASWARNPWRPVTREELAAAAERERRRRWQDRLHRMGVVATVVVIAALVRRSLPTSAN